MPPLPTAVSPASDAFRANAARMQALTADIAEKATRKARAGQD